MSWQEIYKERLTTPQEAMKVVKDGDTVMVPIFPPPVLVLALAARRNDLKDVMIRLLAPAADPGWLRMPDESVFKVEFELFIGDFARFVMDERRGTYLPNLFSLGMKGYDSGRHDDVRVPDVAIVTVSKPDNGGFVHFGMHHWVQRSYARRCPKVIAQVDESLVPVHGDVYLHVSEIDKFVEFTPPPLSREEFDQIVATVAVHQSSGSCSLQSGLGLWQGYECIACARTRPCSFITRVLVADVPMSMPMNTLIPGLGVGFNIWLGAARRCQGKRAGSHHVELR